MEIYHWHHVVPRHAGGGDEPENLIKVTVEQHAELHFARYLLHGEMGDWLAYHALSGQIDSQEVIYEKAKLGGAVTSSLYHERLSDWGSKGGSSKSLTKTQSSQKNLALGRTEKPIEVTDQNGVSYHYPSLKEASLDKGLHRPNLSSVLSGKRKTVNGYTARFL